MPFTVEAPTEVAVYTAKWNALLDHVHSGLGLRDQLRDVIDAYGKQASPEEKVETEPDKRYAQVQDKVAALSKHFAPVVGTVTVWAEGLKPLLKDCGANLDGLPLFSAVNGVHMAFARASNVRIPDKPHLDLTDAASLERRARWLRDGGEVMQRVEDGPREIGAAIRALEDTLSRFENEMDAARGRGRKGNTSALRWFPPVINDYGPVPDAPRPAPRKDELAWLYS
jgi:hypothetical protein